MQEVDTDKSGTLDWDEFLTLALSLKTGAASEEVVSVLLGAPE